METFFFLFLDFFFFLILLRRTLYRYLFSYRHRLCRLNWIFGAKLYFLCLIKDQFNRLWARFEYFVEIFHCDSSDTLILLVIQDERRCKIVVNLAGVTSQAHYISLYLQRITKLGFGKVQKLMKLIWSYFLRKTNLGFRVSKTMNILLCDVPEGYLECELVRKHSYHNEIGHLSSVYFSILFIVENSTD